MTDDPKGPEPTLPSQSFILGSRFHVSFYALFCLFYFIAGFNRIEKAKTLRSPKPKSKINTFLFFVFCFHASVYIPIVYVTFVFFFLSLLYYWNCLKV